MDLNDKRGCPYFDWFIVYLCHWLHGGRSDRFPSAPQLGDSHQLPLWLVRQVTKFLSVGCRWKWCGVPQARALEGAGVLACLSCVLSCCSDIRVLVVELLSSAQEGIHPAPIGNSPRPHGGFLKGRNKPLSCLSFCVEGVLFVSAA